MPSRASISSAQLDKVQVELELGLNLEAMHELKLSPSRGLPQAQVWGSSLNLSNFYFKKPNKLMYNKNINKYQLDNQQIYVILLTHTHFIFKLQKNIFINTFY